MRGTDWFRASLFLRPTFTRKAMKEKAGFRDVDRAQWADDSGAWSYIPYVFTLLMLVLFWIIIMPKVIPSPLEIWGPFRP
jgi:hypothetical protein